MDSISIKGVITVYEGNKKEKVLARYENAFLDGGRMLILDLLDGTLSSLTRGEYNYLVIGNGTSPTANRFDASLGNEVFRKPVSSVTKVYPNRIIVDTYIENTEANFNWTEIGLVAGGDWLSPNSGTLLNKAVVNEAKNSGKSKTVSWEITIS